MIRDITLGQYYPSRSVIHELDPRMKIILTLIFIIQLFIVKSFIGFGISAVPLIMFLLLSKVPLNYILRGMKPIFFILIFTFLLNMFMYPGDIIFTLGFLKLTEQGIYMAVFMGLRLTMLIIGSSLLTFTTTPIKLTDGIEKLLHPTKKIGVPTHEVAMMMSIALRFIPTLIEETDKIMKAQQARGADFESGNILQRGKALIPILVPLFVSAFQIAQDLAMAMEARCYRGGEGRTRLHEMRYEGKDYMALFIELVFLGAVIALRIYGNLNIR
ncbi:MAG: energy-coupling factor transporter transmembrane component T [Anaerovoracaceae bacterium]|nr:energy-coupling factor transporter transmembrane component T [Anaerovoracaceae bacterium]